MLRSCIESLLATIDVTAHEIIVLDNESADAETHAYFSEIGKRGVRVRKVGGAFNFARIVNSGAAVATGGLGRRAADAAWQLAADLVRRAWKKP